MNLDKMKSVFPDFQMSHFNMFDKIVLLKWETILDHNSWEEHTNLTLGMTSPDHYKILLEFQDVFEFYCSEVTIKDLEKIG